jgi:hypothetical protein
MYSINASFQFTPVDGGANDADDLLLIRSIEVGPSQADVLLVFWPSCYANGQSHTPF